MQNLAGNVRGNEAEIRGQLEVIRDNTPNGDWGNNLFAGVAYFLLGDKDEGISCVEPNVDFGYEGTVSKSILDEMKKGELDAFTLFALQRDLEAVIDNSQTIQAEPQNRVVKLAETKQASSKRRDLTKEEIIEVYKS